MEKDYFVYILASRSRALYIGVTNDLQRRLYEHRNGKGKGFTKRYKINRLVYFEHTTDIASAIQREKVLKGWRRSKKIDLIKSTNPSWRDLSQSWD